MQLATEESAGVPETMLHHYSVRVYDTVMAVVQARVRKNEDLKEKNDHADSV